MKIFITAFFALSLVSTTMLNVAFTLAPAKMTAFVQDIAAEAP